jgi:hypothetical protein
MRSSVEPIRGTTWARASGPSEITTTPSAPALEHNETALSASTFPATFGVRQSVALIASEGDDVLHVVTENNSVYALEANSGAILAQRNLRAPLHTGARLVVMPLPHVSARGSILTAQCW